jgi:arylsulfatase A-like enzyme
VLVAVAATGCGGGASSPSAATPATGGERFVRPNIVLVVADDLDVPTALEMPRLPDLLSNRGLSFTRAYASQALCTPSRVSMLTGQYSHNHGVIDNEAPRYGFPAFRRLEPQSLAPWLKSAGYRTALVGKYLNGYAWGATNDYVPPGWDEWHGHLAAIEDGRYFNYWMNHNGQVARYGSKPEEYSADVETKLALEVVRASAGRPEPLFLLLAPQAPHTPAKYADRHGADFRYSLAPRTASFNLGNVAEKPSWVRQLPLLTANDIAWADNLQRFRLRSLRAVEEQIAEVLRALDETQRLENTYVIFTSDHGLLMGQQRAVVRKGNAYEESIGVPLVVRGPGVPAGRTDAFASTIDLAPTLLELAGVPLPDSIDGRSLVPFLRGRPPSSWRAEVLVDNFGIGHSHTLRTAEWMLNHQDTEEFELYDMRADPSQVYNLYKKADPGLIDSLRKRLAALVACRGASCRS